MAHCTLQHLKHPHLRAPLGQTVEAHVAHHDAAIGILSIGDLQVLTLLAPRG